MIRDILDAVDREWSPVADMIQWGEDEIHRAQQHHPGIADLLHHSFSLLRPTHDRMSTEFVYRGHARELLRRLAHGEDTRPATAAEIVLALGQASHTAPLNDTGVGLLFRMWHEAFPEHGDIDPHHEHRETLHGHRIDDAEAETRAKLAVPDRQLGTIDCAGLHHGERVTCHYAPATHPHSGRCS